MHTAANAFKFFLKANTVLVYPFHHVPAAANGSFSRRQLALSLPGHATFYVSRCYPSLAPSTPFLRTSRYYSWGVNYRAQWDKEAEEATKDAVLDKVMKGRHPTDLMLRCTIFDSEGQIQTISGQFKKSDLSTEHKINARDLRKIDSRVPNLVPTILVRKEAFLVNILHIRALVKADKVLLFDTYGSVDSRLHSGFLYHLEHNLKVKNSNMPYEFRALESILLSVLSALEAEMVFIRNLVGGLLTELDDDIDHDRFKRLLHYSRRLTSFENRSKLVQEALEEILQQDEDLVGMYLTDRKNGVVRQSDDHEELEMFLESFQKQVEEIVNEATTTQNHVQSTQEIVELILDSNRNDLLALDLKVSMATFGVGTGAMVAGIFGMNLTSHFESHGYAFYVATCSIAAISLAVILASFRRLRLIRKIGLSSNSPLPRKERRYWLRHWNRSW